MVTSTLRNDFYIFWGFGSTNWYGGPGETLRVTVLTTDERTFERLRATASAPIGPLPLCPPPDQGNIRGVGVLQTLADAPIMTDRKDIASPSAPTTIAMTVPLGSLFTLGVEKYQGFLQPIVALPALFGETMTQVSPVRTLVATGTVVPRTIALFPDQAIVRVDTDVSSTTKRYVAVHLGSAQVRVTPIASTVQPVTYAIEVVMPTTLGHAPTSWDEYFSNVAHNVGIPPEYLKGQAMQESPNGTTLREANWRYEPCVDATTISNPNGLADTNTLFKDFRLYSAINRTLFPGTRDDLDPRSRFFIIRPDAVTGADVERTIDDNDRAVTAREIWDNNDRRHSKQNWSDQCAQSFVDQVNAPNSTVLDFSAQTPTASSSGFQQVMWEEAAQTRFWDGVTENAAHVKKPKYVFDRLEYLEIGGGSVQIGANKVAYSWNGTTTTFPSLAAYERLLNRAFRKYNWYWRDPTTGRRYGDMIMDRARIWMPAAPTRLFQ
jgi:hypothetical protein